MMAPEFLNEQLGLIRKTFFAGKTDRQFFQERDLLSQAIAFPAAHLKERYGVKAPDSVYGNALRTVIETIVAKGNRAKIERFSVYFLYCVQEHMKHHGEEYYDAAKASLRLAEQLPDVLGRVRRGEIERTADVLIELHRTLKSRAGRKKKAAPAQPTLF
jgi:hypothetical protein